LTRRRWIADEVLGDRAALVGGHADHLVRVLRARVGQEFDIAAGDRVRRGRISSIGDSRVDFDLGEEVPVAEVLEITLALAVFKFDRMEWAIEKSTELGVARIVPVIARRTDSHLAAAAAKRTERWHRIAREASEQARRVSAPEIGAPIKFKQAVDLQGAMRVVLSESEKSLSLTGALRSYSEGALILAVGPEGGWTEEELGAFHQAGWISASLGNTILRAETAAIAAVAVAISEVQ
jgi:16S rRNA (uracil1498-N3)-methyltransferase